MTAEDGAARGAVEGAARPVQGSKTSAPASADPPQPSAYVATRAFSAYFESQLLSYAEGEPVEPHVAADLRAKGAPIRPVK